MNLSQLLERVYRAAGVQDRYFVTDLLNDALHQLTDGAKLEAAASINMVGGAGVLPADFKSPIALIRGTMNEPEYKYPLVNYGEHLDGEGYAIFTGQVYVGGGYGGNLTLLYYRTVDDITPQIPPGIDARWHHLLSTYAIGMCLLRAGADRSLIDRYLSLWEIGKTDFKQETARKRKRSRVREVNNW